MGCLWALGVFILPAAMAYMGWHWGWVIISAALFSIIQPNSYDLRARLLEQGKADDAVGRAFYRAYGIPSIINGAFGGIIYAVTWAIFK